MRFMWNIYNEVSQLFWKGLSHLSEKAVKASMRKLSQLSRKAVTAIMKKLSQLSGKAIIAIMKKQSQLFGKAICFGQRVLSGCWESHFNIYFMDFAEKVKIFLKGILLFLV